MQPSILKEPAAVLNKGSQKQDLKPFRCTGMHSVTLRHVLIRFHCHSSTCISILRQTSPLPVYTYVMKQTACEAQVPWTGTGDTMPTSYFTQNLCRFLIKGEQKFCPDRYYCVFGMHLYLFSCVLFFKLKGFTFG